MTSKLAFFALLLTFFLPHVLRGQWSRAFYQGGEEITCFATDSLGLFAGTSEGVLLSTDNGNSWQWQHDWGSFGGTPSILSLVAVGTNLFAAIGDTYLKPGHGIFRSTDEGYSWTTVGYGLTDSSVTSLAIIGTTVFAGTSRGGGVFRSTDSGEHWIQVKNGLAHDTVTKLVASGANLYAGAHGGIALSTNNGDTWTSLDVTNISKGLSVPWAVTALAVDGTRLIANLSSIWTDSQGEFFSSDNGASWRPAYPDTLPSGAATFNVTCFVINGSNIFVSADDAVAIILLSTDSGMTWRNVTQGQPHRADVLTIIGPNILAGSGVVGIWVASLADFDLSGVANSTLTEISLKLAPYPDPITSTTTISFTLPGASQITLTLTDAAGRETPLLPAQYLSAGQHEVSWDARSYPSGVYLCRIEAGGGSATRRMVVMH